MAPLDAAQGGREEETLTESQELYWIETAHEHRHGCQMADCDVVLELPAVVVGAELAATMRRNPAINYCRRRGCGHGDQMHQSAGCMAEGCDCEELRL